MRGEPGGRRERRGIAGPPLVALVRVERRVRAVRQAMPDRVQLAQQIWVGGLVRGVALGTGGLLLATGASIVKAGGTEWWQLALVVATVAATFRGKLHPVVMIVVGGVVGLALGR